MAFPAEGVEATYRNNIDHVAALLKDKHGRNYLIYNLSNRPYDFNKFQQQVIDWCGFPDHHPPPLELLFKIIHSIDQWLNGDEKNVVAVHCLVRFNFFKILRNFINFVSVFLSLFFFNCFGRLGRVEPVW